MHPNTRPGDDGLPMSGVWVPLEGTGGLLLDKGKVHLAGLALAGGVGENYCWFVGDWL